MARNNRNRRQRVSALKLVGPTKPAKRDPHHARCPETGKLRYKSIEAADRALKDIILHGPGRQVSCRSYRCQHCDGFHHTSQPKYGGYAA